MADSNKPKPSRFLSLPRSQRNRVRVVARDSFFEADGKVEKSIELVCDRVRRVVGLDHVKVGDALAVKLIRYWDANGIFEPESIFVPGEPGFDEVDE